MEILITNLSSRATSSQRVLLSAAGGQSGAHSYLVLRLLSPLHSKTLCLFKQKEQQQKREKERDMCGVLFLFVTGFTKLCFNKLLKMVLYLP